MPFPSHSGALAVPPPHSHPHSCAAVQRVTGAVQFCPWHLQRLSVIEELAGVIKDAAGLLHAPCLRQPFPLGWVQPKGARLPLPQWH